MRTITYGGAVSLDGFLAAADGAIDWLHFSADVQQIISESFRNVDTILMGRKTWEAAPRPGKPRPSGPRPAGRRAPSKTAAPAIRTHVFSRTVTAIDDPGVELVTTDAAAFVRDLKQQPGQNIILMGGGELARSLMAADLVDKVGLNIHPILLGSGVPVFRDPGQRLRLALTECRPLDGGCILARYDVVHRH